MAEQEFPSGILAPEAALLASMGLSGWAAICSNSYFVSSGEFFNCFFKAFAFISYLKRFFSTWRVFLKIRVFLQYFYGYISKFKS